MTQTKGHRRVNLHLAASVHAKLAGWCRRRGMTIQDGTAAIIENAVKLEPQTGQLVPSYMMPYTGPDTSGLHRAGPTVATTRADPLQDWPNAPKLRTATREDYKIGIISCDLFLIPGDWMSGDGRTRHEMVMEGRGDDAGEQYCPPECYEPIAGSELRTDGE